MARPPLVLGLTLCEDVVADPATQNVSVIRAFTGLGLDGFPAIARPFCVFAALAGGQGEVTFVLEVTQMIEWLESEFIHRVRGKLSFADPLQTVYWLLRLQECPFPEAGEYLLTLWIGGEWLAHRRLRVYLQEDRP